MTITYLNMATIRTNESADEVVRILNESGYHTITVNGGEIKLGWKHLTKEDLQRIRQERESNGHELNSVCQASWLSRPLGLDMLNH